MHVSKGILAAAVLSLWCSFASANDGYAVAAEDYRAGRWQAAAAGLQAYVSQHPHNKRAIDAVFYLAEAQLQLRNFSQAAANYEKFLSGIEGRDHPDAATAKFRAGEVAFLLGRRNEAARHLHTFCRQHPNHNLIVYCLPYLAEMALEDRHCERAAEICHEHLQRLDQSSGRSTRQRLQTFITLARAYAGMEQWARLRELSQHLVDETDVHRDPSAEKIQLLAAQSYQRQQQPRRAARALMLLATTAQDPKIWGTAMLEAGACYEQLDQPDRAAETYTSILIEADDSHFADQADQRLRALGGSS